MRDNPRRGLLLDLGSSRPGEYTGRPERDRADQPHRREPGEAGDGQEEHGQRDRRHRRRGAGDEQQVAGVAERQQAFPVDQGWIAGVEEGVPGQPRHRHQGADGRQPEGAGQPLHRGAKLTQGEGFESG